MLNWEREGAPLPTVKWCEISPINSTEYLVIPLDNKAMIKHVLPRMGFPSGRAVAAQWPYSGRTVAVTVAVSKK